MHNGRVAPAPLTASWPTDSRDQDVEASMDLGFETVGNATLIVHDRQPVLVTDPWVEGTAYFGSWSLAYDIPDQQRAAIHSAPFVWFSHGHPDHLNPTSLPRLLGKHILLADHVGGRIATDLRRGGFDVTVLKDRTWTPLSNRIRVMCLADYNQDSVLLVDVGGRLVVNLNDSMEKGWGSLLRRIIRSYPISFVLRLAGYGDADMINFFDEDGEYVPSGAQLRKESGYQVGAQVARTTDTFGARFFVPFSSFHRYQRTDSDWANRWTTSPAEMANGFDSAISEILPAFIRYDCNHDSVTELDPSAHPLQLHEPEEFGDVWSDQLDGDDLLLADSYFRSVEHLSHTIDFVDLRVGGREHRVPVGTSNGGRGVTFEVPRGSLIKALEWNIFDDLLIGNFMRTTLHGKWPASRLNANVTPYVTKYADNGHARSEKELRQYFAEYRKRMGFVRSTRHTVERTAITAIRAHLQADSPATVFATRTYQRLASRR
jgi:hypothetical protein